MNKYLHPHESLIPDPSPTHPIDIMEPEDFYTNSQNNQIFLEVINTILYQMLNSKNPRLSAHAWCFAIKAEYLITDAHPSRIAKKLGVSKQSLQNLISRNSALLMKNLDRTSSYE